MLIDGGSWRESWGDAGPSDKDLPSKLDLLCRIAKEVGTPVAILRQVPFQPALGGLREDALIAATFKKFYETRDPTWPLLPAMARAASAGMDAVTEISQEQWGYRIESFTVTGASKRGWTTYLVAACDRRVKAIAPMVIDMLNLGPQMKHQLAAWGSYSPQIGDYTRLGLQQLITTPLGKQLSNLVDPFQHARFLTMPKIVILGTNDPYWPVDASRFYFDQLPDPSAILNVPNNGHGLSDIPRVVGSIGGLHRCVAENKPVPSLKTEFIRQAGELQITVMTDSNPLSVYVWQAFSDTRDFRAATWTGRRVQLDAKGRCVAEIAEPETGFTAGMIEAQFDLGGTFPLSLTTEVRVVPDKRE